MCVESQLEEPLEVRENIKPNPVKQCAEYSRDFQALYDAALERNVGKEPLARYHLALPAGPGYLKLNVGEGSRLIPLEDTVDGGE